MRSIVADRYHSTPVTQETENQTKKTSCSVRNLSIWTNSVGASQSCFRSLTRWTIYNRLLYSCAVVTSGKGPLTLPGVTSSAFQGSRKCRMTLRTKQISTRSTIFCPSLFRVLVRRLENVRPWKQNSQSSVSGGRSLAVLYKESNPRDWSGMTTYCHHLLTGDTNSGGLEASHLSSESLSGN